MLDRLEVRLQALQTRMEFMEMLRARHFDLANETANSEVVNVHLEIADLLAKLVKKYLQLEKLYDLYRGVEQFR